MRMQPGAATIEHDHVGMEEVLIIDGDFVSYEADTHHNSRTKTGCTIAVFEWQRPASEF
jgi:anti-sigma factor ChrR (cupin superfamily)